MNLGKKALAKESSSKKRKATRRKKKAVVIALRSILVFILVMIAGTMIGFSLYAKNLIKQLPAPSTVNITPEGYSTRVLDSDGNQIEKLAASGANREYVKLDKIPKDVQNAFIAIEDERFWSHNGVDIRGIMRAVFTKITSSGRMQGASTITQQLLKNNYFSTWTSEKGFKQSLDRKIQEQYLAIQIEKTVDKKTILENYLNSINLGQNTLGVEAASKRYFNKDVSELTLSESAVIAGITQNPSKYNPISHPDQNAKRRKLVLGNMLRQKLITKSQYDEAINDDVYSRIQNANNTASMKSSTSYFVDAVTEEVVKDLVDEQGYTESQALQKLYSGGLTIYSTQNSNIQTIVENEVNNQSNYPSQPKISFSYALTVTKADGTFENYSEQSLLKYYQQSNSNYDINYNSQEEAQAAIDQYKAAILKDGDTVADGNESVTFTLQPQASATVIDQKTGKVLALVGGRGDKTASKTLNRATNVTRQPGSTFKILAVYAPALDAGGKTLASVEDNTVTTYASSDKQVKNASDNEYTGFTTFREGIQHSYNVVAVRALAEIGTSLGYQYVQDFGISTLTSGDNNQAMGIGGITNGVTNVELCDAYATIANSGKYHKPTFYTKVMDHDGNVILDKTSEQESDGKEVIKETTAWLLTSAMQDVFEGGTASRANIGNMSVAGKTGTTNDSRDTWLAGFSPYYTCTVWGGYDDNSSQSSTIYSKNIWRQIMSQINSGLTDPGFPMPSGIEQATVCKKSGKLPVADVCNADPRGDQTYTEYFATGTVPTETCDHHIRLNICTASNLPAGPHCPADSIVSQVFITGGSPGTADEPYLISEDALNQTCNVHLTDTSTPATSSDLGISIPEITMPNTSTTTPNPGPGDKKTEKPTSSASPADPTKKTD